jgi:hypothetical protein
MNRRIVLLLLTLFADGAHAASVHVTFDVAGREAPAAQSVEVRARPLSGGPPTSFVLPLPAGGVIELPAGGWELQSSAADYWSLPLAVDTTGDKPAKLAMQLWRTATLHGEVTGAQKLGELRLYVQSSPDASGPAVPATSITCPVDGRKWSCRVPGGTLDVAVRAQGYVTVYRWAVGAMPGQSVDAGTIELRRGASLTGYVLRPKRQPDAKLDQIKITLEELRASTDPDVSRATLRHLTTEANARGFFHFIAAPGSYQIQARAGSLISDSVDVRVIDGREAELREPLLLAPMRKLTVNITPPVDPFGKPWTAELQKVDRNGVVVFSSKNAIAETGLWNKEGLTPGHYRMLIRRTPVDAWYAADVDIASDTTLSVDIPLTRVTGTATLAGKPLVALLWFGGKQGEPRVGVRTRPDGTFRAILPEKAGDSWTVDVVSQQPYIDRTLDDVKLRHHDDGTSSADIELPGNTIAGEVVDTDGRIQDHAIINVTAAGGVQQQILSDSGTFSVTGLAPGRVALRAETQHGETESPVEVDVSDSNELTLVRLTIKHSQALAGIVRSSFGPLAGATVTALPINFQYRLFSQYPVDEEGKFRIVLPPRTSEVFFAAAAPGYACRIARVAVQEEPPMPVFLDGNGGRLAFTIPEGTEELKAYLIHDGAVFPAFAAAALADGAISRQDGGRRAVIPLITPGPYSVCWLTWSEIAPASNGYRPDQRCASGLLATGGSLDLTAPALSR